MVCIYEGSRTMNDCPVVIKYGSRALLDYQITQKMSEEVALKILCFLACDPTPTAIESLCSVKN